MGLAKYWKKRDFAKTPEPAGKAKKKKSKALSFVVQKHDATRLHWDFRLEMEGVLRSWAVPKGPSVDPADRRYAAHVEDHPIEYGTFEGVIPEGQYGGGPVVIWDRGTWEPEGDPVAAYRSGTMKFTLRGVRMKGRWMLVRMHGKSKDPNKDWLLIKEKDAHAKPGKGTLLVDARPESVVSKRNLAEVLAKPERTWQSRPATRGKTVSRTKARFAKAAAAAKRGRRASSSTVAIERRARPSASAGRVDPSKVPGARRAPVRDDVTPQLCTLVDAAPAGEQWIHEIKFDGYRLLCVIEDGRVRMLTRNGKDWTDKFQTVAHEASKLPVKDAVLDGEVVVVLPDGRTDFQRLQNALKGGPGEPLAYYVFDLLHLDGFDLRAAPLLARKAALARIVEGGAGSGVRYSDHVEGRGPEFVAKACERGLEGIISKRGDRPYHEGRGHDWLKVKCTQGQEVVIVGFTDPAGAREGFGALLLAVHDAKGALRFAGKVGTGFTDASLRELRRRLAALETDTPPVVDPPRGFEARGSHWVEPKLVCEVEFTEWTGDGRLRHPSFKGLRADKPPREIVRERPDVEAKPIAHGKTSTARTRSPSPRAVSPRPKTHSASSNDRIEVAGVSVSHPDRVLYAEQGVTKLEIAQYYEAVADWILPHVAGRPLSLLRCPEGPEKGECFYQKHISHGPAAGIVPVPLIEKGAAAHYMSVESLTGIVSLVQMGVLEIHLWGCRADRVEEPDRMVFDLDPDPSVGWDRVTAAASHLRARLRELGLESFVKTTGGKGLHVVVPLRRRAAQGWDMVKDFSRAIVDEMVAAEPGRYTANMRKSERTGRVFLDYLRNGRGATAIAPYSTRARAGATVALPITWEELDRGVKPADFTVRTTPKRLASQRSDPWKGIAGVKQSLTPAMLKSVGMK